MTDRTPLAVWLEETFRECPRPTSGPWPMSPEANAWEDANWERLAEEARAADRGDKAVPG